VKTAIIFALLLISTATVAGAQQPAKSPPIPFHWNSKDWQELGGADRVSQLKSLSSVESDRILDALVERFKPGKGEADSHNAEELRAQAAETRIKFVDLNGDGVPEVIAQASDDEFCGATGNCAFWVFMRSGPACKLILSANAIQTFTIQQTKTNGFFDLVLGMHGSATEQGLFVYQFMNGRYWRGACYDANWARLVNGELQDLKAPIITPCKR
jgi:hypothetical protein